MGYNTDVAIAIYGEPEKITAFIAAHRMTTKWKTNVLNEDAEIYNYKSRVWVPAQLPSMEGHSIDAERTMISYEYDGKWYPSFDFVEEWEEIIRAAYDFEGVEYEYVQVGEDGEHTSDNSVNIHGYLYVQTHIDTSGMPREIIK